MKVELVGLVGVLSLQKNSRITTSARLRKNNRWLQLVKEEIRRIVYQAAGCKQSNLMYGFRPHRTEWGEPTAQSSPPALPGFLSESPGNQSDDSVVSLGPERDKAVTLKAANDEADEEIAHLSRGIARGRLKKTAVILACERNPRGKTKAHRMKRKSSPLCVTEAKSSRR